MVSLVLSLLAIGAIGSGLIVIKAIYKINKNKKPMGLLSFIGLIIFSGIAFLGVFIGIDDMRGTKLTEKAVSNINYVVTNFKAKGNDKLVENKSIEPDENNSKQERINTIEYIPPEEIEAKNEVEPKNEIEVKEEVLEKDKEKVENNSTENTNTTNEYSKQTSPVDTIYPAEIVDYKLRDAGNHTTSLVYSIKNNSDKTIYTYKIVILLYDSNGNPVYIKSKQDISDNMIQEVHHDYNINSNETRGATADIIKSDKISKVKIVISEVQYVGTSEIWVNPEINNIIQNRNRF